MKKLSNSLIIFLFITKIFASEGTDFFQTKFGVDLAFEITQPLDCFPVIEHNIESRSKLLQCIKKSTNLIRLKEIRTQLLQEVHRQTIHYQNSEIQKTLSLYQYLIDHLNSKIDDDLAWVTINNESEIKYLNLKNTERDKFPYKNGDIVLTYGGNGTSGLIHAQAPYFIRLSHAFIVKVDKDKTTLESLPHTNAKEFSWKKIEKEKYDFIQVIRWKDDSLQREMATKAVQIALEWTRQKVPFDFSFQSRDEKVLYCTLMSALAYSKAANLPLDELYPMQPGQMPENYFQLYKSYNMPNSSNQIHPASLLLSPYFKVVAEFRDHEKIKRVWQINILTHLLAEKFKDPNFKHPKWNIYKALPTVLKLPFIDKIPIVYKSKVYTKSIGADSFINLATFEKKIVGKVMKQNNELNHSKTFHQVPIWQRYDQLKRDFELALKDLK